MGWGRSIDNGTQLATAALWRADVRLIQVANCLNKPGMGKVKPAWAPAPFDKVDRTTVCAGESRAKACSGDSGGPLFFTNGTAMLVGVVSWTGKDSCGKPEIPNVYSSVSAFETWIKRAMATRPDPQSTVQRVP
jgi:secreted trypsin-like serine protease